MTRAMFVRSPCCKAGPCVVTQRKTQAKDGYDAAQIGLVEFVKESRLTQPMKGHFAKNNLPPMRFLREVAIVVDDENQDGAKVGDKVLVDMFDGDEVCGRHGAPARAAASRAW